MKKVFLFLYPFTLMFLTLTFYEYRSVQIYFHISSVWNDGKWDMQHSAVCKIFYFNNAMQQLAVIET